MKKSKELELLVADIQRQLSPGAEVLHNVKLKSRTTSTTRQIDVLVKQRIGQYEMLIVIDSKDYNKPVDVKGVEEFFGLVTDVGASKGVLVCPAGFTQAAKERAKGLLIDLYRPVDTGDHKWKAEVTIPAICDFRSARFQYAIASSAPQPMKLFPDFLFKLQAHNQAGEKLGTPSEVALSRWNNGALPTEPGIHNNISLYDLDQVMVDNGYGTMIPASLTITLHVEQQLFYGQLPISKISGFEDATTGLVIANAFETGLVDPNEIIRTWKPVREEDEMLMPPVRFIGLLGYE